MDTGATKNGRKIYPGSGKVEKPGVTGAEKHVAPKAGDVAAMDAKTSTEGQHKPAPGESKAPLTGTTGAQGAAVQQSAGNKSAADVFYPKD